MGVVERFRGLADATRLRMINLLDGGELCGCDIQYVLKLSQPNVSRHLTYLKRSGLVTDARRGNRVFYGLKGLDDARHGALFAYLRDAFGAEHVFAQDKRRLQQAVRNGACSLSERPARSSGRRRT
jgi:ArsR family transcriptional regulator